MSQTVIAPNLSSVIIPRVKKTRPNKNESGAESTSQSCDRVSHMSLKRWVSTTESEPLIPVNCTDKIYEQSPFVVEPRLNTKIALWNGDLTCLDCDAIVNPTNETFSDASSLCTRLIVKAGHPLINQLRQNYGICRTGDLKISEGFNLPCRHIVHTVGPKYKPQFHSAAETALHSCYQKVLSAVLDNRWSSIAIPPIHTARRNYPPQEGAHIAIRSVRRFLEKYHHRIELIVLAVEDIEAGVYESILPLYFPRNQAEELFACFKLPKDIGGPNGEPVLPERAIRIQDKPLHSDPNEIDLESGLEASVIVGRSSFALMQADVDRQWLRKNRRERNQKSSKNNNAQSSIGNEPIKYSKTNSTNVQIPNQTFRKNAIEQESEHLSKAYDNRVKRIQNQVDPVQQQLTHQIRFEALLRSAQRADISPVARLDWLYMNGHDRLGRKLLVLIGAHLPQNPQLLQLCLLQLVRCIDKIRTSHDKFALLYVHSNCEISDNPSVRFIRNALELFPSTYTDKISSVYILHAGFWFRMMSWWFVQFRASWLKPRIVYIRSLSEIDSALALVDLRLPQFVLDHDFKINGLKYVAEEVSESL